MKKILAASAIALGSLLAIQSDASAASIRDYFTKQNLEGSYRDVFEKQRFEGSAFDTTYFDRLAQTGS